MKHDALRVRRGARARPDAARAGGREGCGRRPKVRRLGLTCTGGSRWLRAAAHGLCGRECSLIWWLCWQVRLLGREDHVLPTSQLLLSPPHVALLLVSAPCLLAFSVLLLIAPFARTGRFSEARFARRRDAFGGPLLADSR